MNEKTDNQTPATTSLKEVLGLLDAPLPCKFQLNGQWVELAVRRAMPGVMEKRREIMRAVQPPFIKERNDYDMLNPQYLARRDLATLTARSLTVYACCPAVAELKPGLVDAAQIHQQLSLLLPENVMELMELTALAGGMDVEVRSRANFTSAAPSES